MKQKIYHIIRSSIGDGKVKIIYGPKGTGKTTYLLNVIKEYTKHDERFIFISLDNMPYKDILPYIKSIDNNGKKTILLIENILSFEYVESLINLLFSCKNIDSFATSDVDIDYILKETATQIRGRIKNIFYPNYLFEEYVEDCNDDSVINYYRKMVTEYKLYAANRNPLVCDNELFGRMCQHINELCSYRMLYNECANKSLSTIIKKVEEIVGYFYFYKLNRFSINTMQVLKDKFYLFPTDYSLIPNSNFGDDRTLRQFLSTSVVEKLKYDGWEVFIGTYNFQRMIDLKRKYLVDNDTIVAKKYDKVVFIRIESNQERNTNQVFNNINSSFPKIILTNGKSNYRYNSDGIIYCGIEMFLQKGIEENGIQ